MQNRIDRFRGAFDFLSNFHEHPFIYDGVEWPTVEHAFQAAKSTNEGERELIRSALTPLKAKRRGRQVVELRPGWDDAKIEIMHEILMCKFEQNADLMARLIGTGDSLLVEGNKNHDNIWGDCICPRCAGSRGNNLLGQLLMRIREELKQRIETHNDRPPSDEDDCLPF